MIRKPVFTFDFDRFSEVTPKFFRQMRRARRSSFSIFPFPFPFFSLAFIIHSFHSFLRSLFPLPQYREKAIVISTPKAVKSLSLKYVELLHELDRAGSGQSTTRQVAELRAHASECVRLLRLWRFKFTIFT